MSRGRRGPSRTCVGCREVRPQAALLRLVRTPEGIVEADPCRRFPGRGAYVCQRLGCLVESVRRGRWSKFFRAPTAVTPELIERLHVLLAAEAAPDGRSEGSR